MALPIKATRAATIRTLATSAPVVVVVVEPLAGMEQPWFPAPVVAVFRRPSQVQPFPVAAVVEVATRLVALLLARQQMEEAPVADLVLPGHLVRQAWAVAVEVRALPLLRPATAARASSLFVTRSRENLWLTLLN
jgi:hypothetical protein